MDYNNAIAAIKTALEATGTIINTSAYDGFIVKKLESSNTLDDGRRTNQTHIAITGSQMDIFPYIRADGYFNETESDSVLKKYFVAQVPVFIHQTNCTHLDSEETTNLAFDNGVICGKTSVVRSKRKDQADQIQVSLLNMDDPEFISFRKMLHAGSYFVLLKRKNEFKYDAFGLLPDVANIDYTELQELNNKFFKLPTNTAVDISSAIATNVDAFTNNEKEFKKWLSSVVRENGERYSENTLTQYIGALKSVGTTFPDAIGPFSSVFEIDVLDALERACASIKSAPNFEEFNKARGNGSLSAGLELYCKFLQEKNCETIKYLSPKWFRQTASSYSNIDEEAKNLYQQFQSRFSPERLRALTDDEILGYIFLGASDHSLCNALEFDPQYRMFGSIAGGVAYKYGLFYSNNEKTWKTSVGEGGQRSVSEAEALEIGKSIRDSLVTGADIIANHDGLSTISEYNTLLDKLNGVISQHITKMWFLKYYHMIFPSVLPNYYNENWQKHILCNLGIVPSDSQFIRMGQISTFINSCEISCMVFSRIMDDYVGSPKSFYRIGTGDNGCYFGKWKKDNYVAIGWNELGNLSSAYQDNADNKAIITDALKSIWNYDNRLASRKYGEINSFFSATADNSYVVAMAGQKVLGIGVLTGSYFFDENKEYAHCRPVRWIKVFNEGKSLPIESEGKLTTFYELKNSENICYLYSLLNGEEDNCFVVNAEENSITSPIKFVTGISIDLPRNRILFGAPGTGKSYTLNRDKETLLANGGEYERVTFHPDYSYANFVGTYKPVPCVDNNGNDIITYDYVPGPFMRTYVKALKNSRTDNPLPYLLIIEEINRANVAGVFGDVFQLLDRDDEDVSEYAIQASEDIKKYLSKELGGEPNDYSEILIPNNMFIWATMNSADQGVFPMDTAFKRRWDFTYLGIDDSETGIAGKKVILGKGEHRRVVEWNELRKAINEELLTYKVNEDKLMGPYFISKKALPEGDTIDTKTFTRIFKNKVIMYLFDDAAKQKRLTLFGGCAEKDKNQYSKICAAFDSLGVDIFCDSISGKFTDKISEDNEE